MRILFTHFVLAAGLMLTASMSTTSAAPALGDRPVKWEYAELTLKPTFIALPPGAGGNAGERAVKMILVLSLEGEEIEGDNWKDLADKVKATPLKKAGSTIQEKLRFLNHLGREGWELIEHQPVRDPGPARGGATPESWSFKRRLP